MPLNISTLIFRADKYSSTGENQINEAETLRRSLMLQPFSDYLQNPSGGATAIMAYPSASGDAKCCSRECAFVLERITNITALGGHDDRLSALLARVPAALWRRGGLRSIPGRGALA